MKVDGNSITIDMFKRTNGEHYMGTLKGFMNIL